MKTIRVTLAEVPTDVLVYLADHGPADVDTITAAIAPADAEDPRSSVASAVKLLRDGGWVESAPHRGWRVTGDGRMAVTRAREQAQR